MEQLRSRIRERFGSESALARDMGLRRQVLNHYLLGQRQPPIQVIAKMADMLQEPADRLIQIFLNMKSPNGV